MNKQFYKSNLASENYLQNTIEYVLNEISNLMKVCYGPYGSHVLIANKLGAEAMKDGQRILSSYVPSGSIANSVLQSIKSVSNKQAEEIGDGTTTTILLLCQLYNKFKNIMNNNKSLSPSIFNKVLREVVDDILSRIENHVINVVTYNELGDRIIDWELLRDAVHTSVDANDDLTDIIIDMFRELNSIDPLVIIDTTTTQDHRYELVKGIELNGAPISPETFFNGYSRKNINAPRVVLVNGRADISVEFIMELDNDCMRKDTDYIFLCTGIDDDKLSTLISLKNANPALLNRVTFFQINITGSSDEFLDTAAALGTTPIDSETLSRVVSFPGLMKILDNNSGTCEKSLITEFCIRFNHPNSDDERIKERIDIIDAKINDIKNDPTSHNDLIKDLEDRKAFLSKNFAKLYIGGTSPQRRTINYELAKDGVLQATSCLKNGVVSGCNSLVPLIVEHLTNEYDDANKTCIALAISLAYNELFEMLVLNKFGSTELLEEFYKEHDLKVINLRDGDDTPVLNSSATDRTILENATDMAALLVTSKAYLSNMPEFDSLNNQ